MVQRHGETRLARAVIDRRRDSSRSKLIFE